MSSIISKLWKYSNFLSPYLTYSNIASRLLRKKVEKFLWQNGNVTLLTLTETEERYYSIHTHLPSTHRSLEGVLAFKMTSLFEAMHYKCPSKTGGNAEKSYYNYERQFLPQRKKQGETMLQNSPLVSSTEK